MISLSVLLLSIVPLGILGFLTKIAYQRGLRLRTAILGITFVHELLLVVFPVWYSVFTEYYFERKMLTQFSDNDFLAVITGEVIFVTLFAIGIQIGRKNIVQRRQTATLSSEREQAFLFVLIGIGFFIHLFQFLGPLTSFDSAIAHSKGSYYSGTIGMLTSWFKGFFQTSSLVASALVLVDSKGKKYPLILRFMAFSCLAFISLVGLSVGIRGRIVVVALLLAVTGFVKKRKAPIYVGVALIGIMMPLFIFLGGPFRSIYYSQVDQGNSRVGLLRTLTEEVNNIIKGEDVHQLSDRSFVNSFAERAQATRNSMVLYRLHEDGFGAGFRPLAASFVLPIPRVIWPGKGVAGSSNSSTYGAATYMVRRLGYGAPLYNMGPYLASAQAYWEGGWLWLIFSGFVTGLIWNVILRWYAKSGKAICIIIALIFVSGVLANGFLTAFQPLFEFVRLFWAAVFPTMMLSKGADVMLAIKRGFTKVYPQYEMYSVGE